MSQIDTSLLLFCIKQKIKIKKSMLLVLVIIAITADVLLYIMGGNQKWGK